VLDEIVQHVLPGHASLPTRWQGEVQQADQTPAPSP
jgi:hypothetical protein